MKIWARGGGGISLDEIRVESSVTFTVLVCSIVTLFMLHTSYNLVYYSPLVCVCCGACPEALTHV